MEIYIGLGFIVAFAILMSILTSADLFRDTPRSSPEDADDARESYARAIGWKVDGDE